MSLEELIQPEIKVSLFGKEYDIHFSTRNFAAIQRTLGISETQLMDGLMGGKTEAIIAAIWGSTLKFKPFSAINPTAIEDQVSIEKLYNLSLAELSDINKKVKEAFIQSMPEPKETNIEKKQEAPQTVGTGDISIS